MRSSRHFYIHFLECALVYELKVDAPLIDVYSPTGTIQEWDLIRLRPSSSLDAAGGAVWCMEASPDGSLLATGSEDGRVCMHFNKWQWLESLETGLKIVLRDPAARP